MISREILKNLIFALGTSALTATAYGATKIEVEVVEETDEDEGSEKTEPSSSDLTKIFLDGVKEVVSAGSIYAENVEQLTEKKALYECGLKYATVISSDVRKADRESLNNYYSCIKGTNAGELKKDNLQFAGFDSFWLSVEDEEANKSRNAVSKWWSGTTLVQIPHPLVILKKGTEDLGKFAFMAGDAQNRFTVAMKEAVLILLERSLNGESVFDQNLRAKLKILNELCSAHTVFNSVEKIDIEKTEEIQSEYSSQTLIEMGQMIGSVLASSGGMLVLPYEQKVRLGIKAAGILYPIYSASVNSKDPVQLKMGELVKFGTALIKEVKAIKPPSELEDDVDAQYSTMQAIVHQIKKINDLHTTNIVKRAEFKKASPLAKAFQI